MASTATGEMFTQEQYESMTPERRQELDLVKLTPNESATLAPLTNDERKQYLKARQSKRVVNKRERQNRRKARATR